MITIIKKIKNIKYKMIFSLLTIGLISTNYFSSNAIAAESIEDINSTEIQMETSTGEILNINKISAEIQMETSTGEIFNIK